MAERGKFDNKGIYVTAQAAILGLNTVERSRGFQGAVAFSAIPILPIQRPSL